MVAELGETFGSVFQQLVAEESNQAFVQTAIDYRNRLIRKLVLPSFIQVIIVEIIKVIAFRL